MRRCLIAGAAGIASVTAWTTLPPIWILAPSALVACALLPWRQTRWLGAGLAGVCWGIAFGHLGVARWIPPGWEGVDLGVEGVVASLPRRGERSQRFEFVVERVTGCPDPPGANPVARCASPGRILLSWYGEERIRPGEKWRFTVRLNRPHGNANPGAFDYEAWLFSRGIAATGYVRDEPRGRRISAPAAGMLVASLRESIRDRLAAETVADPLQGLLMALAIGESSQISSGEWSVLSRTGTNHLFVISGLHVGLVAAMVSASMIGLRRLAPAVARVGVAPFAAIACCLLYAMMAGFGLPAQRAAIMLTSALASTALRRPMRVSDRFCAALLVVLICDPLATTGNGFWLSFGCVFFLLFAFAGRTATHRAPGQRVGPWVRAAAASQWALFFGLFPLLAWRVQQVALLAPLVNLVAVPWIGCCVVPLLLLAVPLLLLFAPLAGMLLWIVDRLLACIWALLEQVAALDFVWFPHAASGVAYVLALLGALLLCAPRGCPARWLGCVLYLPLLLPVAQLQPADSATITVLDVGQGLAVIVQIGQRTLVFDTGGRFSDRYDLGASAVLPFLREAGIDQVDLLVVSHGESDHAGGAAAVVAGIPVRRILSGSVPRVGARLPGRLVTPCHAGEHLFWNGFDLDFLHPDGSAERKENDRSCVLRIAIDDQVVLLPGDIERDVERRLVARGLGPADVLVAPHHGSATSSSSAFLNRIRARWVLVSAGYNNRFDHPHPAVVERIRRRGARLRTTAEHGALTVRLVRGHDIEVSAYREREPHYWSP